MTRTHCKHGHELVGNNVRIVRPPGRKPSVICQECKRINARKTYRSRRKDKFAEEAMRVNRITALHEELDRETVAFRRAELKEAIAKLQPAEHE